MLKRLLKQCLTEDHLRQEVMVQYFGRTSEFLVMNAEFMKIPGEGCSLNELLDRLRSRGARWAYELDGRVVICMLNGQRILPHDVLLPGSEISLYSRKTIFEP